MLRKLFFIITFISIALSFCPGARAVIEDEYVIEAGDKLHISVWGHQDLEQSVGVRSDGTIRYPLIGSIKAVGYTISEFADRLRIALDKDYIIDPFVTITVETPSFFVIGEVQRPGSYQIEGKIDVLKALTLAGGFTEFGSHNVKIIREGRSGQDVIPVNVDSLIKGASSTEDYYIRPNDVIIVP